MKKVYLIRHAKSSWDHQNLRDIERPLNERGMRDAPFMAKMLKGKGIRPEVLISSPAIRALMTASFFKIEFGLDGEDLHVRDEIYESLPATLIHLITMLPEDYDTIFLFGHNPDLTSLANLFTKKYIDNIPTCGVIGIHSHVDRWIDFSPVTATVQEYYYPKQYL
jgi:phosphohistidine phosphatase